VDAGWTCVLVADGGDVELEQLDDAGAEWYATGPGGEHMGQVREVIEGALGDPSPDPAWLAVVLHELAQGRGSHRRSMLLVKRTHGTWFHATFRSNRESISRHGLDWARMTGSGIAGSRGPEAEGVFLCADLEGAEWFAQVGRRRGEAVDIWAVRLDGTWLIGDPGGSGGGDDYWMICPERIPPAQLNLVSRDWRGSAPE
jgi:hypothetical protein